MSADVVLLQPQLVTHPHKQPFYPVEQRRPLKEKGNQYLVFPSGWQDIGTSITLELRMMLYRNLFQEVKSTAWIRTATPPSTWPQDTATSF